MHAPRWSVPSKIPLVAGLVALIIAEPTAEQLLESLQLQDQVEISAHRGSPLSTPENTLSAVQQASSMIDRGVDNIITNDPASMVRVLAERAELDNAEWTLLRFHNVYAN